VHHIFWSARSHLARCTMLRASTYSKKKKTGEHYLKLTTRKQKKDAKDKGDICGWFGMIPKLPRGRPKKEDKLDSTTTTTTGGSAVLYYEACSSRRHYTSSA
jgi:hypothetical protein